MVSVRVNSKLEEPAEILFAKDRMAPEGDRFHSQNTRKCNFIGKKKKPQEFVWKCIEKHMKIHETKIRRPATKEDKYVSSWSRSHSPIDSCSLFIRNKNINHKQLATNTGYAAIHYSNPGVGIGHDWATEGIVFLHCSYFCNCTKNPNSQ